MVNSSLTIGEVLLRARTEKNITLAQLAANSKIREGLIKQTENNNFAEGPLSIYTKGHIRTLSMLVGVDRSLIESLISERSNQINEITEVSISQNLGAQHVTYSKPKKALPAISYKS